MLSKKEISKLKINVFNQCDDETIRLVAEMLKHTEQLESDNYEQNNIINNYIDEREKLIEKLEEDKETLKKENADGTLQDYVIRLLEILKGES